MRDHQPIPIEEIKGTFSRGRIDTTPTDHLIDSLNIEFLQQGIKTRRAFSLVTTLANIKRMHRYARTGEADRFIILNSSGQFFDSLDTATPILTIASATDFSMTVMFNRAYITPHTGSKGLAGSFVYVYNGTGSARKAAGNPPSGFTLTVADSATSGNVEAGLRLFAVAFETDSGFITQPGPVTYTQQTAAGSKKLNFSNIPVGPAGTAKRHLICTKRITGTYTGRQQDYALFFVSGGEIANNTDTMKNDINFFDADLVESADYLLDQLSEIPAFSQMINVNGRLVGTAENAQTGVVRASKSGEPESFSSTEGFLLADPGDDGDVLALDFYRDTLYLHKTNRSFYTQDNGDEAATWTVRRMDSGIGSTTFGVGRILDAEGSTTEYAIVASRPGLFAFNGQFPHYPISWKYENVWKRINFAQFQKVQVIVDSINKQIYCNVPLDGATEITHVLLCDFTEGLEPDQVKWTMWTFPKAPTTIAIDIDTTAKVPVFKFGSLAGNIHKIDSSVFNDFGTAIDSYARFAFFSGDGEVMHFAGFRANMFGSGNLQVTTYEINDTVSRSWSSISLSTTFKERTRQFNVSSEKCSFRIRVNSANEWFEIVCPVKIYMKQLWASRPNV